jgi:hypothetical protein
MNTFDDSSDREVGLRWDVGFGLYGPGPDSPNRPDLVGTVDRLRRAVLAFGPERLGGRPFDYSIVSRWAVNHLDRNASWTYKAGKFDERRWMESLNGVPERYDDVIFHAADWHLSYQSGYVGLDETRATLKCVGSFKHGPWVSRLESGVMASVVSDLFDELVVAAAVPGVQTGFVQFDTTADPFGRVLRDQNALDRFEHDRWVRGYYWALLLTAQHMELLDGPERFAKAAPCEQIVEVDQAGQPAWVCRLTTDPLTLTAARMAEWRHVLKPVLPEIYLTPKNTSSRFWFETEPPVRGDAQQILTSVPEDWCVPVPVHRSLSVRDPETVTVLLHPGPAFDPERDTPKAAALVRVWTLYGQAHLLAERSIDTGDIDEQRASVTRTSELTWDSDDDYQSVLSFTVHFGPGDQAPLLQRLAYLVRDWAPDPTASRVGLIPRIPTIDITHITIT